MILALTWGNFKQRFKFLLKLIVLALIICYLLPKLFLLFVNFASPLNIPNDQLLEKPLRVTAKLIP